MSADAIPRLNAALDGRYRIEGELGEGGMATVYLAKDLKHNRSVALKVLKPELAAVVGAERFLAEIETTAKLTHPNILPLYDSGEADDFLFYVMPYVEGESLRERLDREHQLPVDDAVRIASDAAEALEYAHTHGVIHRDIKPANILLQSGRPLLSDFGIALAVSVGGGDRLTKTGLSIGTPQYMSPEQATGNAHIGSTTDVYSLGCVLYEMLVGEPPHGGATPQSILARKLTESVRDVSSLRETVPSHVADALVSALRPVPADRFQSAADFAQALRDRSYVAAPAPRGAIVPEGRGRLAAALPWLVAVASLLFAVVTGWPGPGPESYRLALELGSAEPVFSVRGPMMAVAPDGKHIVYLARDSTGRRLYLKSLEGGTEPVRGSIGAMSPFFSPDSERLGFFAGGQLRVVEIGGGEPVSRSTTVSEIVGAAWLDDGRITYVDGVRAGPTLVSSGGGEGSPLTTEPEAMGHLSHRFPTKVPDAPILLYWALDQGIYALDLERNEHHFLVDGSSPQYADGVLFFSRPSSEAHSILAVRLDDARTGTLGEPVVLLDGVRGEDFQARYAVSESGLLAYVPHNSTGADRQLLRIALDGSRTVVSPEWGGFAQPSVSPDGRRIAVRRTEADRVGIWVLDAESGSADRLTDRGAVPMWSPSGDSVVYSIERRIEAIAWSGGEPRTVLELGPTQSVGWPHGWSADSLDFVYSALDYSAPDAETGVLVRSREGFGSETLASAWGASLSPDGSRLAYASGPTSVDMRVYTSSYPGLRGTIPVSGPGAFNPTWGSAERLFFIEGQELVVIEVEPNGSPVPDTRQVLYRYPREPSRLVRWFGVYPGGEAVLAVVPRPVERPEIVVITNWLEGVRERVGG